MVIWTVMPEEAIFTEQSAEVLENELKSEEINYAGCQIVAQATTEDEYRIVRLITTDPNDYLNANLQPGKLIYCKKTFEASSD